MKMYNIKSLVINNNTFSYIGDSIIYLRISSKCHPNRSFKFRTMSDGLSALEALHAKIFDLLEEFNDLPYKDIRIKHLEVISTQVSVALINLKINLKFAEELKNEFEGFFNHDREQELNYIYNFVQTINESIIETSLFQTELIFRFYYSKLNGTTLAEKATIPRMTAILFDDTENNWTKKEAALIPLFWTWRNTIHTGGIYFDKVEGKHIIYDGKEYAFEYGKAPEFIKGDQPIIMVSELLDSIAYLFKSDKIKNLGTFDHPSYYALGY